MPPLYHPVQAGQLSLQALPDYAALVQSGGEVTDVTVAAVTAAASAAAAAAAAAVVAAAGKEIETKLQVGWLSRAALQGEGCQCDWLLLPFTALPAPRAHLALPAP